MTIFITKVTRTHYIDIMKSLLTIVLLLIVGMSSAFSQNVDREIFPEQVSIEHNQAVKSFSGDYVTMSVSTRSEDHKPPEVSVQTAIVTQIGMENMVTLNQTGELNYADITTDGNFNTVEWLQDGRRNWVSIVLDGSSYEIDGLQDGNYNEVRMNYQGDGFKQTILQEGNHQFLEFTGRPIPMTVTQRGDGATVIIENR